MDWKPIEATEQDKAFMQFQEQSRQAILSAFAFKDAMQKIIDTAGKSESAISEKPRGQTFKVKPHFEWTPFTLSYNAHIMNSPFVTQAVQSYFHHVVNTIRKAH